MLAPSGVVDSAVTRAPSAARTTAARSRSPHRWRSRAPRAARRAVGPRGWPEVRRVEVRRPAPSVVMTPDAVPGRSARRALGVGQHGRQLAFDLALDLGGQLGPEQAEQLDPVVGERVVRGRDHRTGQPSAARRTAATPGVGSTPRSTTSAPSEARPAEKAACRSGPERRVSRPTTKVRAGRTRAAARPEGQGQLGRQLQVGDAPHPVGAETGRRHGSSALTAWSTAGPCGPS